MNEREARAFMKLQNENTELKKQLASFQHTKEKTGARESPPPTKEQRQKEIMAIQDREARIKTIARNMELFTNKKER